MATKQSKPPRQRESLVDWVLKSQAVRENRPPEEPGSYRRVKLSPEVAAEQARYIPLRIWVKLLFGDYEPHENTRLRWVHDGKIYPPPVKIGKQWWVRKDAEYLP